MNKSNKYLAYRRRAAGIDLLYEMDGQARCKGQSAVWLSLEMDHEAARTQAEARAAALPAVRMCADCPVRDLCEEWAVHERYTGLAAGLAWVQGMGRNAMVPLKDPEGWIRTGRAGVWLRRAIERARAAREAQAASEAQARVEAGEQ